MLVELSIKNFAIIDEITVSFDKGLTVLTGETGAGKSIIIDAVGLLIGGRGSVDYVRHGAKRAEIEGLFIVHSNHPLIEKANELGIDVQDNMFILRRDITAQGKSVCRVNGKLATIAILREIGQSLVDIHGQHEHQVLMQPIHYLSFLDEFGKKDITTTKKEYKTIYDQALQLKNKVNNLNESEREMAQKLDLYTFQLKEIEKAELQPNEDEQLLKERQVLAHSEKLYSLLQNSYHYLYGEERGLELLSTAATYLEEAATIDEQLKDIYTEVQNSYYALEDATFSISSYMESIAFDPNRLHFIESRLHTIEQLKRKYGSTVNDILEYAAKIEEELDILTYKEDHLTKLERKLDTVWRDLFVEANALTSIRKKIATILTNKIHEQLQSLYMENTEIDVRVEPRISTEKSPLIDGKEVPFGENGIDSIQFYLSTNRGEPLKPLHKIASGGEMSRIMLAMKSIFSSAEGITSVIFDEVDTGVSGRVAQAVAEKIYNISIGSQVLCITHLPQVAAMADTHLFISKKEGEKGRISTSVSSLNFDEKVKEIARMISGVELTDLTIKHAKELLQLAEKFKENV